MRRVPQHKYFGMEDIMSAAYIKIALENRTIVRQNYYRHNAANIPFEHTLAEHQSVEVITPDYVADAVELEKQQEADPAAPIAEIVVMDADSFWPDTELVLNFANAYHPGGGYLVGSSGQEECLCRASTLYASLSSEEAEVMYDSNKSSKNPFNTDYMLISPCVEVFRNDQNRLLDAPRQTAVITMAAPDIKFDRKVTELSQDEIDQYMVARIHQFFAVCARKGYASLTLGAWGCGAFGHDAVRVAGYFYKVLSEYNMDRFFRKIVFAVKGRQTYNYYAFEKQFQGYRH